MPNIEIDGSDGYDTIFIKNNTNEYFDYSKISNIEHIDMINGENDSITIGTNDVTLKISMDSGDTTTYNSNNLDDSNDIENIILAKSGDNQISLSNRNELVYNGDGADTFVWTKINSTRSDGVASKDTIKNFSKDDDYLDLRELGLITSENIDDLVTISQDGANLIITIKELSTSASPIQTIIVEGNTDINEIKSRILVNKVY